MVDQAMCIKTSAWTGSLLKACRSSVSNTSRNECRPNPSKTPDLSTAPVPGRQTTVLRLTELNCLHEGNKKTQSILHPGIHRNMQFLVASKRPLGMIRQRDPARILPYAFAATAFAASLERVFSQPGTNENRISPGTRRRLLADQ